MGGFLSRRAFLAGASASLIAGGAGAARRSSAAPKNLIYLLIKGGWDVSFCLDPKYHLDTVDGPEVTGTGTDPDEVLTTFPSGLILATNLVKRPAVNTFFDRWGHRSAVINGVWMGSIGHQTCRTHLLTGTSSRLNPDIASIVGSELGANHPLGTIDFSGMGFSGALGASSGRLGWSNQLKILLEPGHSPPAPADAPYNLPLWVPSDSDRDRVGAYMRSRAGVWGDKYGMGAENVQKLDGWHEAMDRADALRDAYPLFADRLALGSNPSLDAQIPLALDLLQNDVCRTLTMRDFADWDTHNHNAVQHVRYEDFFTSLLSFADQLETRQMLDDTLVVVVSEMTRTPRLNATGGKDHWAHTSAMMFGGNAAGGKVYGSTNELVEAMPVELATGVPDPSGALLKYDNFAAGVLEMMDVDPGQWLPGVAPFRGARI